MKTTLRNGRSAREHAQGVFFRGFLKHPWRVGTVVPSSKFLRKRVAELAEAGGASLVVELGAGTGEVTRELLAMLPAEGRLLAIEIDPQYCSELRRIGDRRLLAEEGSAEQLDQLLAQHQLPPPDAVISGIPFSALSCERGSRVVQMIASQLAPGGRFVTYQLSRRIERLARPVFGSPRIEFELRNMPPLRIDVWQQRPAADRS